MCLFQYLRRRSLVTGYFNDFELKDADICSRYGGSVGLLYHANISTVVCWSMAASVEAYWLNSDNNKLLQNIEPLADIKIKKVKIAKITTYTLVLLGTIIIA